MNDEHHDWHSIDPTWWRCLAVHSLLWCFSLELCQVLVFFFLDMFYESLCISAQYEIQTNHGKYEFGHKDIDPDHLNSWKWYELFLVIQVTIWQIVMLSISSKACEQYIDQVPYRYYCYCGKVRDPEYDPWMKPHTCGNLCEKKLPCGHLCNDLCHPGLFFFPLFFPLLLLYFLYFLTFFECFIALSLSSWENTNNS